MSEFVPPLTENPPPPALVIYCMGKRRVAYLDAVSGLYHCECCAKQVPVVW